MLTYNQGKTSLRLAESRNHVMVYNKLFYRFLANEECYYDLFNLFRLRRNGSIEPGDTLLAPALNTSHVISDEDEVEETI